MTISTTASSTTVVLIAAQTVVPFSFIADAASDITVQTTNTSTGASTTLTASQYTVTLNSATTGQLWGVGGYVTLNSAPGVGYTCTITRTLPLQQLISIQNQGDFAPQVTEQALDTLCMEIQQVSARGGSYRGVWATDVIYNFGDIVQDGVNGAYTNNLYVCAIANTSGTWATDLASGDWSLALNIQTINASGTYLPLSGGTVSGNLTVTGTTTLSGLTASVTATGATAARTLSALFGDVKNVLDFTGVDPTGVTDSTTGLQAALTAAGVGGTVYIPAGTYFVSSTLNALPSQQIIGSGNQSTFIIRTGNYGDTLAVGLAGGGAQAATISGINFSLTPGYTTGETTLPNLATSGAHLNLVNAQYALVENCTFNRMPYGVHVNGGALIIIDNCRFAGVYDPVNTGCQEGIANIYLDRSNYYLQLVTITNCYISAQGSSTLRNLTYTCTDGNFIKNTTLALGSLNGISSNGCESCVIRNNYIGGNTSHGIYSNPANGAATFEWRIEGNMFDTSGGPGDAEIGFSSQATTAAAINCTISGNTFNGEGTNQYAIYVANGVDLADLALSVFTITGNSFYAYAGTPIVFASAANGVVSDNVFSGYNALNIGTADNNYINAVECLNDSSNILFSGNSVGGQYAYGGIYIQSGTVNTYQESTLFNGVTVGGVSLSGMVPDTGKTSVIGVLKSANFNITTDQAIPIILVSGQKYVVTDIWVTNASTSLTTAAGGFYSAASKGGTAIVANSQVYSACTAAAALERCTIAAAGLATTFTANPLYLSLTTGQGGTATADVYVRGVLLT